MLKKRIVIVLTFSEGVLYRTKKFQPDYRYTRNFVNLWNADEIILIDISKKKQKKNFLQLVNFFCNNCHLPITVGGGLNSIKQIDKLFKNGAEKIILNSASIKNFDLMRKVSIKYGSQSVIHSIDFKKIKQNKYSVFVNNGKKNLKIKPEDRIKDIQKVGCGEILLNNIDEDGGLSGYNISVIKKLIKFSKIPCLALGGAGKWEHIHELFQKTNISAACTQNIFHFTNESLLSLKKYLLQKKINIRSLDVN